MRSLIRGPKEFSRLSQRSVNSRAVRQRLDRDSAAPLDSLGSNLRDS
jgi:hypothetical protein